MPTYLFESTDMPMFTVKQGEKTLVCSKIPVTQIEAKDNTFNIKNTQIDKTRNLFSVEIETKSSKPITVTESNVPIGYAPLNQSITINSYSKQPAMFTNESPDMVINFTKKIVDDNKKFIDAINANTDPIEVVKNFFVGTSPLFTIRRTREGEDSLELTANRDFTIDDEVVISEEDNSFTVNIQFANAQTGDIFIISENTNLLSGIYTPSSDVQIKVTGEGPKIQLEVSEVAHNS